MDSSLISSIFNVLRPYFEDRLELQTDGKTLSIQDDELGDLASCCTVGEVASFYVCDALLHGGGGRDTAAALARDVRRRQLANGAFGQPYFVKRGESSTVDIAEIGAVANALYHVHRITGSKYAADSLVASANYLLTQVANENPGAVYKNPQATNHDVLNGDVYAAHTWGRAFQVVHDDIYRQSAHHVIAHVADRFGRNTEGWWPYTETWDGQVGMGNSVSYQATILAFAYTCLPLLEEPLQRRWSAITAAAVETILQGLQDGASDENEVPWWSRDWSNTWEIYLALWRCRHIPVAKERVNAQLERLHGRLQAEGVLCFKPTATSPDPERSPVSTTFRKAATFAGILSYMLLDAELAGVSL